MKVLFAIVLCSILVGCVFGAVGVIQTIDDFTVESLPLTVGKNSNPTTVSNFAQGSGIIGGERDLVLAYLSGTGNSNLQAIVEEGSFRAAAPSNVAGESYLQYDGYDQTSDLDPTGLGGINFQSEGAYAFRLTVTSDIDSSVFFYVYSSSNPDAYCFREYLVPGQPEVPQLRDVDFSSFSNVGGGCNFNNVGALEIGVDLPINVDIFIDRIDLIGEIPSPSASPSRTPSPSRVPASASPSNSVTPSISLSRTRTPSSSITPSPSRIPASPSATPSPSSCLCTCPELECYMFKIGEYTFVGERNENLKRDVVEEEGFDFLKFF